MKCPNCNVNLVMSERSGVEIDYCPECRGVWLDRGELDKIIERSNQTQQKEVIIKESDKGKYSSDDYKYKSDNDYKYKKKKGFLGDLFDF